MPSYVSATNTLTSPPPPRPVVDPRMDSPFKQRESFHQSQPQHITPQPPARPTRPITDPSPRTLLRSATHSESSPQQQASSFKASTPPTHSPLVRPPRPSRQPSLLSSSDTSRTPTSSPTTTSPARPHRRATIVEHNVETCECLVCKHTRDTRDRATSVAEPSPPTQKKGRPLLFAGTLTQETQI